MNVSVNWWPALGCLLLFWSACLVLGLIRRFLFP